LENFCLSFEFWLITVLKLVPIYRHFVCNESTATIAIHPATICGARHNWCQRIQPNRKDISLTLGNSALDTGGLIPEGFFLQRLLLCVHSLKRTPVLFWEWRYLKLIRVPDLRPLVWCVHLCTHHEKSPIRSCWCV